MKNTFHLILLTTLLFSTAIFAENDPAQLLKANDAKLQSLLKEQKKSPTPERTEEIKTLINGIFDFQEMGRRALPRNVWNENETLQERFVAAFKAMVENASVKKLEAYESDSTKFQSPEIDEDKARVYATVWAGPQKSELEYKLHQVDGQWKAWDLVMNELSTRQNYSEQFKILLKKKSFLELIEFLESKSGDKETTTP